MPRKVFCNSPIFSCASLVSLLLLAPLVACSEDGDGSAADTSPTDAAPDTSGDSAGGGDDPTAPDSGDAAGTDAEPDTGDAEPDTRDAADATTEAGYRLGAPVRVWRDATGMAHIYGADRFDVAFVQGFETSRDRIWHMDHMRHEIYGTRAAHFGPSFEADDVVKRVIGFRKLGEENAAWYRRTHPQVYRMLEAYAAGVNAYIAEMKAGRVPRPSEFDRIDAAYWPAPWTPADSAAVAKATIFSQSFQADIELAVFASKTLMGDTLVRELLPFTPMYGTHALETGPTPFESLRYPVPARAGKADFDVEGLRESLGDAERAAVAQALLELSRRLSRATGKESWGATGGSNWWAVAGDRTTSGAAILCNDTHMDMRVPSTLYPIHIVDESHDTLGAIGYVPPGTPWVLIGNTARTAWGLTNPFVDVNDLYRERLTRDRLRVEFNGEEVPLEIVDEVVLVRPEGGTIAEAVPKTYAVRRVPHHGPILNDLLPPEVGNVLNGANIVFSVRWTGFNPESSEFHTFDQLLTAGNLDEQLETLRSFDGGVMNWLLADSTGAIGHVPAGPFPVRAQPIEAFPPYDPLPGTGAHEWQGFVPFDEIPRSINPAKGYLVSANNAPGTGTLDGEPATADFYFGHFFDLATRAYRLTNLLEAKLGAGKVTWDEIRTLQRDNRSQFAEIFLPALLALEEEVCAAVEPEGSGAEGSGAEGSGSEGSGSEGSGDGTVSPRCEAIRLLGAWDLNQTVDSSASTIFSTWVIRYWFVTVADEIPELLLGLLGDDMDNVAGRAMSFWHRGLLPTSGTNYWDDRGTPGVVETQKDMMLRALDDALETLGSYYGPSAPMSTWAWGEAHKALHRHRVWSDLDLGPFPMPSGLRTVDAADFKPVVDGAPASPPYLLDESPQIRYCVELAEGSWRLQSGLKGGAQGHVGFDGAHGQLDAWTRGETVAIPFTAEEVEAAAVGDTTYPAGFPDSIE